MGCDQRAGEDGIRTPAIDGCYRTLTASSFGLSDTAAGRTGRSMQLVRGQWPYSAL